MGQTVNILLVDDDEVDVLGVQRAFARMKIANPITVASTGIEALEVLRGQNGREPLTKPYIILLDLNMPRMNGIEFLKELRADPALHSAIVFVMTTSSDQEDMVAAYDLNIAGYIVKSKIGKGFMKLVEMLDHYWRLIELP